MTPRRTRTAAETAYCEERALECELIALEQRTPEGREEWLLMAEDWRKAAQSRRARA